MKNKITIAITGHRDLIINPKLTHQISELFDKLINEYETLTLLSALAIGADQLVAKIFLEKQKKHKNLHLLVPIPFSLERYKEDFTNNELTKFSAVLNAADNYFKVPQLCENAYESLGIYLVNETNILLALWNGTFNHKKGGTGDVVAYAKQERKELIHFLCQRKNT